MASFNFTSFARNLAKADVDFDTATFKVLLVTVAPTVTETTGNQDVWDFRDDVTNEVPNGSGYATGGIAQAFTLDALTLNPGRQSITWTNITNGWTAATFSAVGAIIYQNVGTASTDRLLHFIDFGGTVSCTSGNFSITYSTPLYITA